MALNRETILAEVSAKRLSEVAATLLREWRSVEQQRGGITPTELQAYVGRFGEVWAKVVGTPGDLSEELAWLVAKLGKDLDDQQAGAMTLMWAMVFAHIHVFDLYEAGCDFFREMLEEFSVPIEQEATGDAKS